MNGWLCGDCKSLNTPRAKSCYRCNVPRRFGESTQDPDSVVIVRSVGLGGGALASDVAAERPPGTLPPGAAAAAAAKPRPTVTDARSSRGRSRVLLVLLVATTAWSGLSTTLVLARGGTLGLVMDLLSGRADALSTVLLVSLVGSLLSIATAIAWFVWFDRVLRNVPALTGQWPDTGRVSAIGWWLVPIVGFIKAPRIVGDVYHRLSVQGTPGLWLLALWALTWIGGTVGPMIATRVVAFLPFGLSVYLSLVDLITLLGQASYIAAGIFAVAMVTSMEHASEVRLTGGGAAVAPPASVTPADDRFAAALQAAAESNAVVKVSRFGRSGSSVPLSAPPLQPTGTGDPGDGPLLRPVLRPPGAGGPMGATATSPVPVTGAAGARGVVHTPPAPAAMQPTAAAVPFALPAEAAARRRRPVPRWAMGAAVVAVLLAIVGGVMLAGPRVATPRVGSVLAEGLASPTPAATLPSLVADPTAAPTPAATPSPEPWIAAADRLATSTYAEDWTGRMTIDATLRVGDKAPAAWTLSMARDGDTEWSKSRVETPSTGVTTTETVILARTVWERTTGGEWARRDRGFGDQPMEPLFGVRSAQDLTYVRSFKEGGRMLHELRMDDASDLLALGFLRTVGAGALDRTGATVVTDNAGRPIRATLTYAGSTRAGKAKLVLEVAWQDVDGTFTIGSPKDGDPVVD